MFSRSLILPIIAVLSATVAPARAEKRALVIGEGAYQSMAQLPNPARDAASIAALFRNAGSDTVKLETNIYTKRPHGSLGYKPPAPEVFIPAFVTRTTPKSQPATQADLGRVDEFAVG
jgi:hypothetical protein